MEKSISTLPSKTIMQFLEENRNLKSGVFEAIYFRSRTISRAHTEKVLDSEINPQLLEIFENPFWQDQANLHLTAEKIAILLLASADVDPDTTKTFAQAARKFHCKRKFMTVEHLEILADIQNIEQITEANLRDLIHFCATGKIEPWHLEMHIEKNLRFLNNDDSKIYQKIKKFDLSLDEPTIEFFEHGISFSYLERFRNLSECYKVEFWNWVNLKYFTQVKNPAHLFFQIYDDMEFRGLDFKDLVERRVHIESGGTVDFSKMETGKIVSYDYDYFFEMIKLEAEIANFSPEKFHSREKTNEHHIFFPEEAYHSSKALIRFRNSPLNRVKILINSHEQLNAKFRNLRKIGYEIPIISEELIAIISANREKYSQDYQNFTELKRVVCQICIDFLESYSDEELENHEVFQNACEIFKFLKLSSRFITPKTVKSKKR